MDESEMLERTKSFALRVIRLVSALPRSRVGNVLGTQLLKSGTSIGANYHEARRASSKKHFVALVEIAAREAAETLYWLDLLADSKTLETRRLTPLKNECNEILAILTATDRTAKRKR